MPSDVPISPAAQRAIDVEKMLNQFTKQVRTEEWIDVFNELGKATGDDTDVGAILDRYFHNNVYVATYQGVGDPSRPFTWSGEEAPVPASFAEQYGPKPLPPPPPTVTHLTTRLNEAYDLLAFALAELEEKPHSLSGREQLRSQINDFLKGK